MSIESIRNKINSKRKTGACIYITKVDENGNPSNLKFDKLNHTISSGDWPNHLKDFNLNWMLIYQKTSKNSGQVWYGNFKYRTEKNERYVFHLTEVKGPETVNESFRTLVGQTWPQKSPGRLKINVTEVKSRPKNAFDDSTVNDILKIVGTTDSDEGITETKREVEARLGQGYFRSEVLKLWNNKCAVTECEQLEVLRASHIVPWRDPDSSLRLNPNNGIPLIATLDALFDRGLITFLNNGNMKVSKKIQKSQHEILGIPVKLKQSLNQEQKKFLKRHRNEFFE
jgi:hypothetical protein